MLDVPNDYYLAIKHRLSGMDVNFTMALAMQDAARLCAEQEFHLVILRFPDFTFCSEFLIALRRINYAPAIAFVDKYSIEGACDVLQSGADLCMSTGWPIALAVDHTMAQFRRYVSYSKYEGRKGRKAAAFQEGDIYIDPSRGVVRVKERSVKLRRREFLLLLCLMKNPKNILSAEQICDYAWGNEGSYAKGVSGPIAILRKAIEPDPAHPIYIKTANALGYYFTAYKSETCDICSGFVGDL